MMGDDERIETERDTPEDYTIDALGADAMEERRFLHRFSARRVIRDEDEPDGPLRLMRRSQRAPVNEWLDDVDDWGDGDVV